MFVNNYFEKYYFTILNKDDIIVTMICKCKTKNVPILKEKAGNNKCLYCRDCGTYLGNLPHNLLDAHNKRVEIWEKKHAG